MAIERAHARGCPSHRKLGEARQLWSQALEDEASKPLADEGWEEARAELQKSSLLQTSSFVERRHNPSSRLLVTLMKVSPLSIIVSSNLACVDYSWAPRNTIQQLRLF
jgi:hypothetical protein